MHTTEPKIFLIHKPQIEWGQLAEYIEHVGGERWLDRITNTLEVTEAEVLTEFYGRACYRSWAPGLNANVTKVREDSAAYLDNIMKVAHGSVLEHANFGFMFADVSRVFTHELVRHRAGVAISQESLRYVRLTDLGFRIPDVLANGPNISWHVDGEADEVPMREAVINIVETLEDFQREAALAFGLDEDNVPFSVKKEVTSALRRLAPIGLSTSIGWTANVRTIRFVIQQRTEAGAEEEIRLVFDQVAQRMKEECPLLFADFHPEPVKDSNIPAWVPEYRKV